MRLATLIPKLRFDLTRFHGAFAPNSKHRARVTPAKRGRGPSRKLLREMSLTPCRINRLSLSADTYHLSIDSVCSALG